MNKLTNAVADYIKGIDPKARIMERENGLEMMFNHDSFTWICIAYIDEIKNRLCFYTLFPVSTQVDKYLVIIELVTRANRGNIHGTFEFDFDNGNILYRSLCNAFDGEITEKMIHETIYGSLVFAETHIIPIVLVLEENLPPSVALQMLHERSKKPKKEKNKEEFSQIFQIKLS